VRVKAFQLVAGHTIVQPIGFRCQSQPAMVEHLDLHMRGHR